MRRKWLLPVCIGVLVVIVAVLAVVNMNDTNSRLAGLAEGEFLICRDGNEIGRSNLDFVLTLPKAGFDDQLKVTGEPAKSMSFAGVELKTLISALESKNDLVIGDYLSVSFRGADGYVSAATAAEVAENGKLFIVYEQDGVRTKPCSEGGTGPIEMVVAKEPFSLRNCKYLIEIDFLTKQ